MDERAIQRWIEILRPTIENYLGEMPHFLMEKRMGVVGGAPWNVTVDNEEITLAFDPKNINHFFLNPPKGEAPHPNTLGRLINDFIHDLVHIYQAEGLYQKEDQRFFQHPGYNLSIDGLAEFTSFEIMINLFKNSNDETIDHLGLASSVTDVLQNKSYKKSVEKFIMWRVKYSYIAALHKGWISKNDRFYPLEMLSRDLLNKALTVIEQINRKEAKLKPAKKFRYYDLGTYLGSLLQARFNLVRGLIHSPIADKHLLRLAEIE